MSSINKGYLPIFIFIVFILKVLNADILVQLNVNRPLNDVDDKFLSFAVDPEELYKSLDGPHRKTATRLAAILGESYVKFLNDYNFANKNAKLRNPTRIVWKGFNRWARAINWTMIIPVPYQPKSWDPMQTLKILNTSYMSGISNCVWQLGTDFGSVPARDYVGELGTLNLMVDSFRPYVDSWDIIGADISSGSSVEETRRYIEMSKNLNPAFGWMQSKDPSSQSIFSINDPALKVLLRQKVPVWLTLPQKVHNKQFSKIFTENFNEETDDALHWAQTLGEAATSGVEVIFKRVHPSEFERPNFPYYVSAIFKKVMGSRVFPAKPLNTHNKKVKLYTHCANMVSGGMAFMMVNPNERKTSLTIRSTTKMSESDVWQYILTSHDGDVHLNDVKMAANSTIEPLIKEKNSIRSIKLTAPPNSVCFWVLPDVNLEHCQYTEIEANTSKPKRLEDLSDDASSADTLLKKLIEESSMANNPLARAINRRRRYIANGNRSKRFVLEDNSGQPKGFGRFLQRLMGVSPADANADTDPDKRVKKSENAVDPSDDPLAQPPPFKWIKQLVDHALDNMKPPILSRRARSTDDGDDDDDDDGYFGPLFATKDGRTTKAFTKKNTEIKRPEEKIKRIYNFDDFDEEEFFKKISNSQVPETTHIPEGDVVLQRITNINGDFVDEDTEEQQQQQQPASKKQKIKKRKNDSKEEIKSEMKPLRLLPTEFYESLPVENHSPYATTNKLSLVSSVNNLLYPEPFSKKQPKSEEDKESAGKSRNATSSKEMRGGDFSRSQKELSKAFLKELHKKAKKDDGASELKKHIYDDDETSSQSTEYNFKTATTEKSRNNHEKKSSTVKNQTNNFFNYMPEDFDNYFGEKSVEDDRKEATPDDSPDYTDKQVMKFPWWDLAAVFKKGRPKRALNFNIPEDLLNANSINREQDNEISYESNDIIPRKLSIYKYDIDGVSKDKTHIVLKDQAKVVETTTHDIQSTTEKQLKESISGLYHTILPTRNATLSASVEGQRPISTPIKTNSVH